MPHAELKYSSDLKIDAENILTLIEARINEHDPKAGACKGRAYPAAVFHRSHILVEISMVTKPHRDEAFTLALRDALEIAIKGCLTQRCYFSLGIRYSDVVYITTEFLPDNLT